MNEYGTIAYVTNEEKIELFKKHMSKVRAQRPINELDYLHLCKEAVDLVKVEWQDRDISSLPHNWHMV